METKKSSTQLLLTEEIERNDDLLMTILLRLPPKFIFRFRCVSKRWNDIVVDPFFVQSYQKREREERLSSKGLMEFIETKTYGIFRDRDSQTTTRILPLILTNDREIKGVPDRFGYFIHSSNGLILCGQHPNEYHVVNPLARTCVSLPPPPRTRGYPIMGLACEENTRDLVPDYKVVQADIPRDSKVRNKLSIQTYYSKTREWRNSTLVGTHKFKLKSFTPPPLVFNGVFHWFLSHNTLALYDSKRSRDIHMQLIILPHYHTADVTRSFNNDVLWFVMNKKNIRCLEFWMLPKDQCNGYRRSTTICKNEWILMHTVTHDSLCKDINKIRSMNCLVELVWLIPGNPLVAILKIWGRMCLYNLETYSLESDLRINQRIADLQSIDLYCDSYMEPLSLCSYALSTNTSY